MATHKYLQAARVVKRLPWWWEYGELRRAVVVGLEAALGELAERDRQQPVGDMTAVRRPVLERDVEYGLDHVVPTTDEADGVAVARRVERRMIAQASCARSAAIASPSSLADVCDARFTGIVKTCG